MEIRIESILADWDEQIPEMFIHLVNAIALARNERELRQTMAMFAENKEFCRLFAYGYGNHHLWLKQRMLTDSSRIMGNRLLMVEF